MKLASSTNTQAAPQPGMHNYSNIPDRSSWFGNDAPVGGPVKRSFDMVLSVLLLILLAPILAGLAALIMVTSKGGATYGHERIGYDKQRFKCLKFRTMVANGDEVLKAHLACNPDALEEWTNNKKLVSDPRVTPVGQVLRKLSLDELPQLWNVARGEMSLVGPRPVPWDELQRYGRSGRFYLQARPGITGLWQISGRSETSYKRRIAIDRLYVARSSSLTDLYILGMTVPAVLRTGQTS